MKYSDRVKQLADWSFSTLFFDIEAAHYATAKIPNTLCHLLGDATFKKDIRFAMNCRAYVFEAGQGRPVAALWSCIPDVDRGLEQSPIAKLRIQGEAPEFIDLMENVVEPAHATDGALEVPVSHPDVRWLHLRDSLPDAVDRPLRVEVRYLRAFGLERQ
jgi:hypothetical protein